MFSSIRLQCFRKHEDLQLHLNAGLVAIRGLNEAGKSTVQEAIAYAMFGSNALRQPFAEVVTWGKNEADLKVALTFDDGRLIARSKRGAEITAGGAVVCTGQKECTKYIEQMLGTSADTATKLMLASQNALRGALEGGPTEAAALIEHLADFDLIDRVIDLVQRELTTGNTAQAEANVKRWEEHLQSIVVTYPHLGEYESQLAMLNENLGTDYEEQKKLSTVLGDLDLAGARRFMTELAALIRDETTMAPQITRAEEAANSQPLPPAHGMDQIEIWRRELTGMKDLEARQAAYAALNKLVEPESMWEGGKESFRAEMARLQQMHKTTFAEITDLTSRKMVAIAKRINETECAFCGKDLTAVPEVLLRNDASDNEVRVLSEKLGVLGLTLANVTREIQDMHAVDRAANDYETLVMRYSAFVILISDRYPFRWQWKGEPPPSVRDVRLDYNAMIGKAEKEHMAYQRALGKREEAQSQLAQLRDQQAVLKTKLDTYKMGQEDVARRIREGEQLELEVHSLGQAITDGKAAVASIEAFIENARAEVARQVEQRDNAKTMLETAQMDLREMHFNNALVKRVRSARPVISDKLWSIVLASVSQHFSQIRGVPSVITRADNGFRCDGQAVQGLSGSTLDALGLAIRIALTKTFLPNSRFMLLDEPGAAADDERESNMLGLLAASDFDQVLLITHSQLADSFASQVVSL